MNWQHYLRVRTRDPAFLWRMVIGIIGAGIVLGWLADRRAAPSFGDLVDPGDHSGWDRLEALAVSGEWWQVWWDVPREIFSDLSRPGIIALALFTGVCWLIFLWQVLRVRSLTDWRVPTTLVAVALGVLSIWPTGFLILYQAERWQLRESAELVAGLRYFILGVGLREELAKLVCLLPLMPVLLRKRDELMALVASACVGLGFAIEENIGYFTGSRGTDTLGRFLTANPAHMALTGLIGLAVYRAFRDPRNWGPHALAVFGLLVFAHGLYDAVIVLPDLADYSLGSTIIFALVLYQFFHELRTLRPKGQDTISLTATFLCGVSLLTAATFVYISATFGARPAVDTLFTDLIGLAVMVYLFLREMPETMVRV
ncbi:MAG: PrsW family glutamic-type intramembrane protease [Bythopirellula sp.]|nr:PrsW family glutamic-type intramembrane protease [Bythopirellula sp.]